MEVDSLEKELNVYLTHLTDMSTQHIPGMVQVQYIASLFGIVRSDTSFYSLPSVVYTLLDSVFPRNICTPVCAFDTSINTFWCFGYFIHYTGVSVRVLCTAVFLENISCLARDFCNTAISAPRSEC